MTKKTIQISEKEEGKIHEILLLPQPTTFRHSNDNNVVVFR